MFLLVIAVIAVFIWFLRPVRSVNIYITAQPAGPQYFLVDTKMMFPGAHGKRFQNVNSTLVPVNQNYNIPVDKNLNRLFGQVYVRIYHPEFQPSTQLIKRYRGQRFRLQPENWQTMLSDRTVAEFQVPPMEYRDHAYQKRWKRGEILRLEAARSHMGRIESRYFPLLMALGEGSSMNRSLPVLQLLSKKFTDNVNAFEVDPFHAKSLEQLKTSLQNIEEKLQ